MRMIILVLVFEFSSYRACFVLISPDILKTKVPNKQTINHQNIKIRQQCEHLNITSWLQRFKIVNNH